MAGPEKSGEEGSRPCTVPYMKEVHTIPRRTIQCSTVLYRVYVCLEGPNKSCENVSRSVPYKRLEGLRDPCRALRCPTIYNGVAVQKKVLVACACVHSEISSVR